MKKIAAVLLSLLLILSLFSLNVQAGDVSVKVNGQAVAFDVRPTIIDGRTMVPMRAIFEALGATVTWNDSTKTVTGMKDGTTVKIMLGSSTLYKNGNEISLDVPAQIINGRTMVPVRAVAQSFSCSVKWDSASSTVIITTDTLVVHFIDVGQGDSIFIELPDGNTMLIDAAEAAKASVVSEYINSLGYSKINYIVATHPHSDHIGGMASILKTFPADVFYMPDITHTTKTFENMITAVSANSCKVKKAQAGTVLFESENIKAVFLAPCSKTYSDLNNYSAVIKLTYGALSFLFAADAESIAENEMIQGGYDLSADVLKVGHHGSDSSTTSSFLNKVSPRYAVISAGAGNSYGHPDEATLKALSDKGVAVYRTDILGTITFLTDGSAITVSNTK